MSQMSLQLSSTSWLIQVQGCINKIISQAANKIYMSVFAIMISFSYLKICCHVNRLYLLMLVLNLWFYNTIIHSTATDMPWPLWYAVWRGY